MQNGLRKLEFVVVLAVIAVFISIFLYKLDKTVSNIGNIFTSFAVNGMQQGLTLQVVTLQGQPTKRDELLAQSCVNPLEFMTMTPGASFNAWTFDKAQCQLIYTSPFGKNESVRFTVEKIYTEDPVTHKKMLQNLKLQQVK